MKQIATGTSLVDDKEEQQEEQREHNRDEDVFHDNDNGDNGDNDDNVVKQYLQQQYHYDHQPHNDGHSYNPLPPPLPPPPSWSLSNDYSCRRRRRRYLRYLRCMLFNSHTQQQQQQQQPSTRSSNGMAKPLLIAQLLSLLLATSGAANSSLHFECNVSAPLLQAGMIYLGLALYSLSRVACWNIIFIRRGRRRRDDSMSCSTSSKHEGYIKGRGCEEEGYEMSTANPTTATIELSNSSTIGIMMTPSTCDNNTDIPENSVQGQSQYDHRQQKQEAHHPSIFRVQYASLKLYALMAFLDVEANYLIYLSFRYTTLTSVSLLDALAIPSAMVFSKLILNRRYRYGHVMGAVICIVGMSVNILGDSNNGGGGDVGVDDVSGNDTTRDPYPNKVHGDVLAMIGAVLYGLNNVLTERVVKGANHVNEYLGILGCFGVVYCAIQSLFLGELDNSSLSVYLFGSSSRRNDADPSDEIMRQCRPSEMWMLWFASAILGAVSYTGMARFLAESEAALLNLSLLTGDLWAALFIVVAQGILPTVHFWMSLVLIAMGVLIYEVAAPSPIQEV
eukprot:CAMPEP_0176485258 /NCGR_PEP_ID=MMETSP0200_2-20121128/4945_1 /TAXON_ID=947934 /ORGANISM="Chaetoceros sp., Strain GSL56" /LENGTH=560 /DNA_ID=CAMNT_0017881893 /DNA_START=41 /DNA_END=1723 /DNA_ORIENTATION=+